MGVARSELWAPTGIAIYLQCISLTAMTTEPLDDQIKDIVLEKDISEGYSRCWT